MRRPEGTRGPMVLECLGRDLLTTGAGTRIIDQAAVHAEVDLDGVGNEGRLNTITSTQREAVLQALVGVVVGSGFRTAAAACIDAAAEPGSLLGLLLDEIPIGGLLSGYAEMLRGDQHRFSGGSVARQADVCSGWRSDGAMMVEIRSTGVVPTPSGAPAPTLERADDHVAWHTSASLGVGDMRRRRRLDVVREDEVVQVDAMFRDTLGVGRDREVVVHEYSIAATVDRTDGIIRTIEAVPLVLPWNECVPAAESCAWLVGSHADDVRQQVSSQFRGIGSCTHLNDLLRMLPTALTLARFT